MGNCREHKDTKAVTSELGGLCAKCYDQVKKARTTVDGHVEPKECFVIFKNEKEGWVSFTALDTKNTGCAHWVAHQLNLKGGLSGICAEGYKIRVRDVIAGARRIDPKQEDVKVNDIWVNPGRSHTGLVVSIREVKVGEGSKKIYRIKHCSNGSGGVVEHDHTSLWKGQGDYYRL